MNKDIFSDRLRYAMKLRNATVTSLSKSTGINKGNISSYLSCRYTPKQDKINIISQSLNVSYEWLCGISDDIDPKKEFDNMNACSYFDASISAGYTLPVDSLSSKQTIYLPDFMLGKYAGREDIIILRVNGDSMDRVLPDGSFIAVSTDISISSISSGDIVVFRDNYEYSVKEFINDKKNRKYIFRPNSYNEFFNDIVYDYRSCENLEIIGRVVMYWNTL